MKRLLTVVAILAITTTAAAWEYNNPYGTNQRKNNYNYQQDNYCNYTKQENLYRDSDHDGVVNRYDYNDNNPSVQRRGQYNNQYRNPYSTPYGSGQNQRNRDTWR